MGMDATATLAVARPRRSPSPAPSTWSSAPAAGGASPPPSQRATYDVLHRPGWPPSRCGPASTRPRAAKAVRPSARAGRRGRARRWPTPSGCSPSTGRGDHHRDQLDGGRRGGPSRPAARPSCGAARPALRPGRLPGPRRGGRARSTGPAARAAGALVARRRRPARRPGWCRRPWRPPAGSATQLALAELDSSRARLARAEVRALRAQISPHFVYNALTAIASFVRTDPERARELILEFAEFTRYSFRAHGEFTTLAEELRSIDRYLTIERARFGDRLQVRLQIAPEVLPVALPFLCLQPLVENAVRHGLSRKPGVGTVSIVAARRRAPSASSRSRTTASAWTRRAARPRRPPDDDATPASTSGWPTSTNGCGRCSATSSAWWWRPRRARAPR